MNFARARDREKSALGPADSPQPEVARYSGRAPVFFPSARAFHVRSRSHETTERRDARNSGAPIQTRATHARIRSAATRAFAVSLSLSLARARARERRNRRRRERTLVARVCAGINMRVRPSSQVIRAISSKFRSYEISRVVVSPSEPM